MSCPANFAKSSQHLLEVLSASQMYRDYERAFTVGAGLPLRLQGPGLLHLVRYTQEQENPFSALMAKTNQTCTPGSAQSYALQCRLEVEAQFQPRTLKDFAGLCETAVPVRVGETVIAFLHTGQVLLQRPDTAKFQRIAATLLRWGAEVDLRQLEEAYLMTRVFPASQYAAFIRLLAHFAAQLASRSSELCLQGQPQESPAITQACSFIAEHAGARISLDAVARVAKMNATTFSGKFKATTGINFVDYVARTRIGKARTLLRDPQRRVCEVAYEVGFQSLSQFNRAFKKVSGQSPRDARAALAMT